MTRIDVPNITREAQNLENKGIINIGEEFEEKIIIPIRISLE